MDTKRRYIDALTIVKDAFEVSREVDNSGYFTFHTPNGFVVGKIVDVKPLIFNSQEEFEDKVTQEISNGKEVNMYDIAAGLYSNFIGDMEKEFEEKIISDSKAIVLEDVKVFQRLTDENPIIISNTYVLFSDQIIGLIPSKINK
jgi:hypothetical protein